LFIAFDGIDGAGKTTQIIRLREWLEARDIQIAQFRDPGATPLGEAIRDILLHREEVPLGMTSEMLLYMAARAQLVTESIKPALEEGKCVLCDRFLLANVVYQGHAGGLDVTTLWSVGNVAIQGIRPDITIVLDLDPEVAASRIQRSQDRLEKRGIEYFRRVRQGFIDEHKNASKYSLLVDASQSVDDIHRDIIQFVQPHVSH
jgi:dTMP kinase